MAPKKKSKKPAANPARGFATTSTVSKTKATQNDTSDEPDPIDDGDSKQNQENQGDTQVSSEPAAETKILDLTPEQLEAQLAEAELQHLVDTNREKCQRDISRCVSKLKTERRLLQGSAEHIELRGWIPYDLRILMLEQLTKRAADRIVSGDTESVTRAFEIREDELVIRIWALKRALLELCFVPAKIDEAIHNLLSDVNAFIEAQSRPIKDGLWGLDECIEWLALHCHHDELPGYNSHTTSVVQQLEELRLEGIEADAEKRFQEDAASSRAQTKSQGPGVTGPEGSKDIESEDEKYSSDSDIEPVRQLEKYLQFKTRLHKRRPDMTEVGGTRSKKPKSTQTYPPKPLDSKSSKLLRRIKALEKDLLFDTMEATQRWTELRARLVIEDTKRRAEQAQGAKSITENGTDQKDAKVAHEVNEDDGDENGLGEFFASIPEPSSEPNVTNGASVVTTDNTKVFVRDFGKASGVPPRRVLEEACKARDSRVRVFFKMVSKSSFFCRHDVSIKWSKDQKVTPEVPIKGVDQIVSARRAFAKMHEIACADQGQSESYIAMVALFLIFSPSPKEEKVYLRLSATWRELWMEFLSLKKDQEDAEHRATLQSIRSTIQEHYYGTNRADLMQLDNKRAKARTVAMKELQLVEQGLSPQSRSDAVAENWQIRAESASFQAMLEHRKSLPIWSYKEDLMSIINDNQTIILCGETGCGKSTQLPAYLLEDSLSKGKACKIYCTEPRRISAISLARRVSEELGERRGDVGTARSLVGYAIRLESQMTAQTKLVYATTGIVMRMLERGNELEGITHIVLDEVHERNIDSDFLLIVLRRLMQKRPDLKVVLMSATVDAEQFSAYLGGVPVVNIPGRTFPVETKYLEDAIEEAEYGDEKDPRKQNDMQDEDDEDIGDSKPSVNVEQLSSYSVRTRNVLKQFNEYRIDYELILQLLETVAKKPKFAHYSKAILVFLPGMGEIRRLGDMLVGHKAFSRGWNIIPLHSTISTEEQEKAFIVPPRGIRKIVLATNIAETGITIPDVTCVIDTGKHKEMRFDERRQLSRLIETFISRANAKQRRGRAGRVQDGLCFHLFTRQRHDTLISDAQTPEMLRLSLQDLALRVKICKLGEIEQVLAEALSPPLAKNVRRAVDSLIEIRALTLEQQLTILGRRLAILPLDVYLGKLILLSSVFLCLDAGLTIAAILSGKSPFISPVNARSQADTARLGFKKGDSDLITVYNAYCAWRRTCQTNSTSEMHFCRKNYLSAQALSNIEDLKAQLATTLVDAGFLQLDTAGRAALNRVRYSSRQRNFVELPQGLDINSGNNSIVDSVIAWSFYPKLLVREGNGYRNVANNQNVSIYPASVNKTTKPLPQFLSYYHIMQASSRAYHAHETSTVADLAVAIGCGEGEVKPYSGVMVIDGNRVKFSVADWQSMLVLRGMRENIKEIMSTTMREPGKALDERQQMWFDIWQKMFGRDEKP